MTIIAKEEEDNYCIFKLKDLYVLNRVPETIPYKGENKFIADRMSVLVNFYEFKHFGTYLH